MKSFGKLLATSALFLTLVSAPVESLGAQEVADAIASVRYNTTEIDGISVFYREAGSRENPTVVLLHGFPTSSHMFRELIPALADEYHVVAPDYPGFGQSDMPSVDDFEYTFDHFAEIVAALIDELDIATYSLYLMDYGAPVGYRIAANSPDRVEALIVQNGNAYNEGLREFWDPIKAF
jgi:pimeloyl-ACP methyl ester carboxylesterase